MKLGQATLSWIHFGLAASSIIAVGAAALNIIPVYGALGYLVVSSSAHGVTAYLQRKDKQLEPPATP